MHLVRDAGGYPELFPDDFFQDHGVPVREWLGARLADESPSGIMLSLEHRCAMFIRAAGIFREAALEAGDGLRNEPYVLTNYNTLEGSSVMTFIFKCDNNGNTYRVNA